MRDPRYRGPLRYLWENLRQRCLNPNHPRYPSSGGSGIRICGEWSDPEAFAMWARANGWAPGLWFSRIDQGGDFSPGNCRFVDPPEGRT